MGQLRESSPLSIQFSSSFVAFNPFASIFLTLIFFPPFNSLVLPRLLFTDGLAFIINVLSLFVSSQLIFFLASLCAVHRHTTFSLPKVPKGCYPPFSELIGSPRPAIDLLFRPPLLFTVTFSLPSFHSPLGNFPRRLLELIVRFLWPFSLLRLLIGFISISGGGEAA